MPSHKEIKDFHDAMMGNSPAIVASFLEQGFDPNTNMIDTLPLWEYVAQVNYRNGTAEVKKDCFISRVKAGNHSAGDFVSPLHLAIINLYHSCKISNGIRDNAFRLVKILIKRSADVTRSCSGIALSRFGEHAVLREIEEMTPIQLIILFKRNLDTVYRMEQMEMLDKVADLLIEAQANGGHMKLPTVSVPKSVAATWKNLLFSQDFSDVTFQCPDGTKVYAHKNILAAASEYFHSYFLGPWGENHPDGMWETSNSSDLIMAVLTFIYTGELSVVTVNSNTQDLLRVAQEYNLPELLKLAEASYIRHLSIDNIKDMLCLAHLYDSQVLQKACACFVKQNAVEILMRPEIMALATEQPNVWTQLSQNMSSDKKRKRT